jgi:hypothetical protein
MRTSRRSHKRTTFFWFCWCRVATLTLSKSCCGACMHSCGSTFGTLRGNRASTTFCRTSPGKFSGRSINCGNPGSFAPGRFAFHPDLISLPETAKAVARPGERSYPEFQRGAAAYGNVSAFVSRNACNSSRVSFDSRRLLNSPMR